MDGVEATHVGVVAVGEETHARPRLARACAMQMNINIVAYWIAICAGAAVERLLPNRR